VVSASTKSLYFKEKERKQQKQQQQQKSSKQKRIHPIQQFTTNKDDTYNISQFITQKTPPVATTPTKSSPKIKK